MSSRKTHYVPVYGALFTNLSVLFLLTCASSTEGSDWSESVVVSLEGHYPYRQCKITNMMLIPDKRKETGIFYSTNDIDLSKCAHTPDIWHFGVDADLDGSRCDLTYDVGHVVLIYYVIGGSNYYHLHWDTLIPLYKSLYYGAHLHANDAVAVLPSVESKRLNRINWKNDAFSGEYENKYWNQLVKFIAGNFTYLPLDEELLRQEKTICFKEIYFGTSPWRRDGSELIQQFVQHVLVHQGITQETQTVDRVGIIARRNRRLILNEDDLVAALENIAPTDLIRFDGLTYKQQIELMQNYTVVAGMNGAGLMNCLYLPPTSTCVQMVPHGADRYLNFQEYGRLLKSRGPYTEWHNTHSDMNVAHGGPHSADTTVHVLEFVKVIQEALELTRNARHKQQDSHFEQNNSGSTKVEL